MIFKKFNNGKFNEQHLGEPNVVAPFTTITNRAKIEANCKVVGPVERIRVNSLKEVPNEFGPNGEPVYTSDKEDSRIRFVGDWGTVFNINGQYTRNATPTDTSSFVEISFYGTGFNVINVGNLNRDFRYKIDGGAEQSFVFDTSDILLNRNTHNNTLRNVVSGLSIDWHTVKIYNGGSGSFSMDYYGFEILNESNELSVLSGSVYKNGYEYILENGVTLPFKPVSYVGTKGARVLTYIDPSDGIVKQAVNEVGNPAYLGDTNHSNEAIYRKISWLEFGRESADDFSTLSSSEVSRAFTLDDNETVLYGIDIYRNGSSLGLHSNGSDIYFTFKGTGLDIVRSDSSSGGNDSYTVQVDSDAPISLDGVGIARKRVTKICSGLPYGTHIVKISRVSAVTWEMDIYDFIVYQPKKPVIAKEAFVLSDYNIIADYVFNTDTGIGAYSSGVSSKSSLREIIYTGTWVISAVGPRVNGFQNTATSGVGASFEYTFVGTGFELFTQANTVFSGDVTLEINGDSDLSGLTINSNGGFSVVNALTGQISFGDSNFSGSKFSVSDLPFGKYTIKLTNNTVSNIPVEGFNVITPISSFNTSNGNNSLIDTREKITTEQFNTEVNINQVSKVISRSKNICQVLTIANGTSRIYFEDTYIDTSFLALSNSNNSETGVNSSDRRSESVSAFSANSSGVATDTPVFSLAFNGELQKDVFKD